MSLLQIPLKYGLNVTIQSTSLVCEKTFTFVPILNVFSPEKCSLGSVNAITQAFLYTGIHFTFACNSSTVFLSDCAFPRIIEGSSLCCTSPFRPRFFTRTAVCRLKSPTLRLQISAGMPLGKVPATELPHRMRKSRLCWSL